MEVINLKCSGCGAPLSNINKEKAVISCPYCGSLLYIKNYGFDENDKADKTQEIPMPLCCVTKDLSDNDALKKVLGKMSDVLNVYTESNSIIPIILEILKDKKEAATIDSFPKDYEKVHKMIQDIMTDGEELIFYKTAALLGINKLKTGMFVTTERVGYIEGKKVFRVEYDKLDTFIIDTVFSSTTYWYPNGNEQIFLSPMAVEKSEFGVILAYIVLRAYEKSNRQKSVELKMKG